VTSRRFRAAALALAVLTGPAGAVACSPDEPSGIPAPVSVTADGARAAPAAVTDLATTSTPATTSAATTTSAAGTNGAPAPAAAVTTASATATAPAPDRFAASGSPVFVADVRPIDDSLAVRMRSSWRSGCPVPLSALRYLSVRHWGIDGEVRDGELVVHAQHADALVSVFAELFEARFPIERMRLVDDYGGDDQASMRANNTSAFNCREVAGRPGVLSNHATGTAIDINPLVNPWVSGSRVDPPEGAPYADRSSLPPGGIAPGDAVTRAFARIGWGWGGDWPDSKDWQHFSASGR
jgi:hypothetical protein